MIAPAVTNDVIELGEVVPLDFLRADEVARIVELVGDCKHVHRLEEMGLREGTVIRMVRPGAPCLLALDGKRISLRLDDPMDILVEISQLSRQVAC